MPRATIKIAKKYFSSANIYEWWSYINLLDTHFSYSYYVCFRIAADFHFSAHFCRLTLTLERFSFCLVFILLFSVYSSCWWPKDKTSHNFVGISRWSEFSCINNMINYRKLTTIPVLLSISLSPSNAHILRLRNATETRRENRRKMMFLCLCNEIFLCVSVC